MRPHLPSCLTEHPHPTAADRAYQLGDQSGLNRFEQL